MNSMIKLVKVLSSSFVSPFRRLKCTFFGKEQELRMLGIYGISFNPPPDSFGVAFSANGYDDNIFVIVDKPESQFSGLLPGEMRIGNYLTGASVYFRADGTILINASKINIVGDLEVSGTVTAANLITGSVPDYNAHTHSGVTSGGASTGGPS
jgi:hypothetical protein